MTGVQPTLEKDLFNITLIDVVIGIEHLLKGGSGRLGLN
jgi:hypothetical protein